MILLRNYSQSCLLDFQINHWHSVQSLLLQFTKVVFFGIVIYITFLCSPSSLMCQNPGNYSAFSKADSLCEEYFKLYN